jgi:predicted nucleic acid-binding protein
VRLAADANVLLSALIGGRARLVLTHPEVTEVLTTEKVLAEVREYVPSLALKRKLDPASLLLAVATLPVKPIPESIYRRKLAEARRRIEERDPDDVELLALALHFRIPVWSNDEDFASARAPWLTTAELLARLGV